MELRNNVIAGWTLAGCLAALGATIVGGMVYQGGRPAKMGYPIEGAETGDEGGGEAAVVPVAALLATADPVKGAAVFTKCTACHSINQGGANGIGPNLYATVGEAIAEGKGGYAFSDALKAKGGKWDFEALNSWLTSPRKYAPGTKMTFAGLGSAEDRANVIVYLNQQGSNLPLPPPPAPGAAASPGAAPAAPSTDAGPATAPNTDGKAKPILNEKNANGTPAIGAPSLDPNAALKGETAPKSATGGK